MAKRGMNMRAMKARQMGKAPKVEHGSSQDVAGELPEALDEEPENDTVAAEALVDQGDGVRVPRGRGRRVLDSDSTYECPDQPPPGWGDES